MTLNSHLDDLASRLPEKNFFISESGHAFTYANLKEWVESLCHLLDEASLPEKSVVAVVAREAWEVFGALLAIRRLGHKAAIIPPGADEKTFLEKFPPNAIFWGAQGRASDGYRDLGMKLQVVCDPIGGAQYKKGTEIILFTSGSTGVPKAACLEESALFRNADLVARSLRLSAKDRLLLGTPAYYTSAVVHFLTMFAAEASLAACTGFQFGAQLCQLLEERSCTGFGGAPVQLARFVETVDSPLPALLRFWVTSGDHAAPSVLKEARRKFPGLEIYPMYGLTEVSGRLCILDASDIDAKAGSVGSPIPGMQIRVRRSDGSEASTGEVGEFFVSGSGVFLGYANSTEAQIQEHATGDFGFKDADGFFWIEGRRDDIFKSGAEKVSRVRIEQAINGLGLCQEAAIVSVSDDFLGKVPWLLIVPKTGEDKSTELLRQLRVLLPPSHVPKRVVSVKELPRTGSGKVKREMPRAWAESELGDSA